MPGRSRPSSSSRSSPSRTASSWTRAACTSSSSTGACWSRTPRNRFPLSITSRGGARRRARSARRRRARGGGGRHQRDRARLHAVLEAQHYRLTWWRLARDESPYRRFFDVNGLIGVRVEDRAVFDAMHTLVAEWIADGSIDGLRIDHVDGLADPANYLKRLRALAPDAWIGVEKILADGEALPAWPVDGTTGYEIGALLTRLLTAPEGEAPMTQLYRRFAGGVDSFDEVEEDARHEVLEHWLAGDAKRVALALYRMCQDDLYLRDYSLRDASILVRELVAVGARLPHLRHRPTGRRRSTPRRLDGACATACGRGARTSRAARGLRRAPVRDRRRRTAWARLHPPLPAALDGGRRQGRRGHRLLSRRALPRAERGRLRSRAASPPRRPRSTTPSPRWQRQHPRGMRGTSTHDSKRGRGRAGPAQPCSPRSRSAGPRRSSAGAGDRTRTGSTASRIATSSTTSTRRSSAPGRSPASAPTSTPKRRRARPRCSPTGRRRPRNTSGPSITSWTGSIDDGAFLAELERVRRVAAPRRLDQGPLAAAAEADGARRARTSTRASELWHRRLIDPDNRVAGGLRVPAARCSSNAARCRRRRSWRGWTRGCRSSGRRRAPCASRRATRTSRPDVVLHAARGSRTGRGTDAGVPARAGVAVVVPTRTWSPDWRDTSLALPAGQWTHMPGRRDDRRWSRRRGGAVRGVSCRAPRTETWMTTIDGPLGAALTPEGVHFRVFSSLAERVELCLFDEAGPRRAHDLVLERRLHLAAVRARRRGRPGLRLPRARPLRSGPRPPLQSGQAARRSLRQGDRRATSRGARRCSRTRSAATSSQSRPATAPRTRRDRFVVDDRFDWGDDRAPRHWPEHTVIYELHVKGFTKLHPGVPEHAARHLRRACRRRRRSSASRSSASRRVELMPVHQFMHEPGLLDEGLRNYWGYHTYGFFAPHAEYAAADDRGGQVREFKEMVRAFHTRRPRGDPRRGLQPHRRGQPPRAAPQLQGPRQPGLLPPRARRAPLLHGLHGDRQQREPAPSVRAAAGDGLAALLGHGDARRRLPLRPRGHAGPRRADDGHLVGVLRHHPPGPGAARA